jgi:hypothetical protein
MKNFLVVKKLPPTVQSKKSLIDVLPTDVSTLVSDAWIFEKRRLAVVEVKASLDETFFDKSFKVKDWDQVQQIFHHTLT